MNIKSILIPDSVTTIGEECSKYCSKLSEVLFSSKSSLKRICDSAFMGTNITEFEAPASLVVLGSKVFYIQLRP